MTAALIRSRSSSQTQEGLQATSLTRDLYQIAELIELCFRDRLDASGRSAIREMKTIARLGPLLWLLGIIDQVNMGISMGYVWRVDQRVIGNVSLYRAGAHPQLGRGALIANVAVHPLYRRRGIARKLMEASLHLAAERRARWVSLQVEADNLAAQSLYENLGFEHFETINQWETRHFKPVPGSLQASAWPVRLRKPGEISAEIDLIYQHARKGAITWARAIELNDIRTTLGSMGIISSGEKSHWVLPHPTEKKRLSGALWVNNGWRQSRLSLFMDPELKDRIARQSLLIHVLGLPDLRNRRLRVETDNHDPAVADLLQQVGFKKTRSLTLMRKTIEK